MHNFTFFAGGLACAALVHTPLIAADANQADLDACAVSAFNAKIQLAGGIYDGNNGLSEGEQYHGAGGVAFPLTCKFGVQLDGLVGQTDGEGVGGVAFTLLPVILTSTCSAGTVNTRL